MDSSAEIRLIGPRRSSTLRAMLPEQFQKKDRLEMSTRLKHESMSILQHVAIYSSTASVMDEALIEDIRPAPFPGCLVVEHLRANGFTRGPFF